MPTPTAEPVERGRLEAISPATGRSIGSVAATEAHEVADVVAAVARVQPVWAQLRIADRARYVRRAAQAIIDEFDSLTDLVATETGRPRAEVAFGELLPAIDALRWIAQSGPRILDGERVGAQRAVFPLKRVRVAYEPLGVIGVIGALDAPLAQPLAQVAEALVAGNGAVLKPARHLCLTGERIARLWARAGLPEGLLRVTYGDEEVGRALVRSSVAKVHFTGPHEAGREVAVLSAEQGHDAVLEHGGQDAMLVLADAGVPRAIAGAAWAGFSAAGQTRGSVERVFVAREVYEPFVRGLVNRARSLRVGDPLEAGTQIGPLADAERLAHVEDLVSDAVAAGATLRCGGPTSVSGLAGSFYAPTVLTEVAPQMRIASEPIGGPVVSVVAVESAAEGIALANRSRFGLGASVWTADRYHGARVARELQVGMVWINDHLVGPMLPEGPWGGVRGSGFGRTHGIEGLRGCASPKLVAGDVPGGRAPWWFPYDQTVERAARAVAQLRSARDSDRQRGLRDGLGPIVRLAARSIRGDRGA